MIDIGTICQELGNQMRLEGREHTTAFEVEAGLRCAIENAEKFPINHPLKRLSDEIVGDIIISFARRGGRVIFQDKESL